MADSIPSLRIANQKLRDENAELKRQLLSHEPRVVEKIVFTEGPERIVYRDRMVEGPERVVERVVEKLVPIYVDRIEYRDVIKEVNFPVEIPVEKPVVFTERVPQYPPSVERIESVREIYVTDPALEATIKVLQERLCQFTSQ